MCRRKRWPSICPPRNRYQRRRSATVEFWTGLALNAAESEGAIGRTDKAARKALRYFAKAPTVVKTLANEALEGLEAIAKPFTDWKAEEDGIST
jgi:hypothetical protein